MNTPIKVLIIHRQDTAVGYYRQHLVAETLTKLGYTVEHDPKVPLKGDTKEGEKWLADRVGKYDILLCDRGTSWRECGAVLRGFVHTSPGCRMIVDFDDDFSIVPKWNNAHDLYQPGREVYESGLGHLKLAEMTTVSTQVLVDRYKDRTHAIRLAPNYIRLSDWQGLQVDPERGDDKHLRIFYGGADGHYGDLDATRDGIEGFLRRPPCKIRLIVFGSAPKWLHAISREFPGRVVVLPWWNFEDYPQAIFWGKFDAAIAPLADHPFNEAKSNIKYLEAAAQGIPFMGSNVGPYKTIPNNCAIKADNTPQAWEDGLRALATDAALRKRLAKRALEDVKDNWTVDKGLPIWQSIIEETLARPRIETLEDTFLPHEREKLQAGVAPA